MPLEIQLADIHKLTKLPNPHSWLINSFLRFIYMYKILCKNACDFAHDTACNSAHSTARESTQPAYLAHLVQHNTCTYVYIAGIGHVYRDYNIYIERERKCAVHRYLRKVDWSSFFTCPLLALPLPKAFLQWPPTVLTRYARHSVIAIIQSIF